MNTLNRLVNLLDVEDQVMILHKEAADSILMDAITHEEVRERMTALARQTKCHLAIIDREIEKISREIWGD